MKRVSLAIIENGRATEWLTSSVLLIFAFTLALPGDTLAGEGFRVFRILGMDEAMLSTPLALVGAARLVALYINGNWRRSPILRAIGAIIGAAVLGSLGMAFGWAYVETVWHAMQQSQTWLGFFVLISAGLGPSTGAGTYTVLAAFDILATLRSGADIRAAKGL